MQTEEEYRKEVKELFKGITTLALALFCLIINVYNKLHLISNDASLLIYVIMFLMIFYINVERKKK